MSGPKIDYAEIERRKREELERARQERLRRIKLATDELHKELMRTQSIIANIRGDHSSIIEQYSDCEQLELTISRIHKIKKENIFELGKLLNISIAVEPDDIIMQCDTTRRMNNEIEKLYNSQAEPELSRIEDFISDSKQSELYEGFSQEMTKKSDAFQIEDIVFPTSFTENEEDSKIVEKCTQIVSEIKSLINSDFVIVSDRKELMSFIEALRDNPTSTISNLKRLINEYELARSSIIRRMSEFEDYYLEYIAEYVAYVGFLNKKQQQQISIRPKESSVFENVDELITEINAIKKLAQFEEEQAYIRTQIDEVMQLYGYSMCESIVLDIAQKGRHYVSKSVSDDTAIHIHISESKQLMMEIVSTEEQVCEELGEITAEAYGCEQLSDYQKSVLLDAQGRFCSIHPILSEELRKRGILLTEKVHRKPDVKYCKKIINYVSESNESATTQSTKATRQKKKKKELSIK